MQLKKLLEKWDLTSLKITTPFLEMEWQPKDEDKSAAWELYVELITRVATQHLDPEEGDEAAALASIHKLFDLTRDSIKRNGRHCINFTRIAVVVLNQAVVVLNQAVVVLNQKVRPFTSKWHRRLLSGDLDAAAQEHFRTELRVLQADLRNYTHLLAELAAVEDLTNLEAIEGGSSR